jgi:hypothetical protein
MSRFREIVRAAGEWLLAHPLRGSHWIALAVWLLALSAGMIALGEYVALTTNRDVELYDQAAYLAVAEKNESAWWPAATDGIRNPLFPWLVAKTTSGDRAAVFPAALKLNVRCGALLAILLGVWAGRRLSWLPAVLFVTVGGLGIVLPISTYVGTEVLFYGLLFAAWMLAFDLFDRLTLARCALFGATLGLAYLAKPGVTLLCGAFIAVGLIRWWRKDDTWKGVQPLLGAGLALVIAAVMLLPRALDAAKQFGDPLQNTAANCFWEENWDACYAKLGYLNPRLANRLAPGEWPSAGRYFARNGVAGAWTRLTKGMGEQFGNILGADEKSVWFSRSPSAKRPIRRIFPYRGIYLLPPLLLVAAFGIAGMKRPGIAAIPTAAWFQTGFAVLLVGASFGAFSWYWVIAPGARFILALYLPVLASLLVTSEALRRRLATGWADAVSAGTWLAMLGLFLVHIGIIATHPYFDKVRGVF